MTTKKIAIGLIILILVSGLTSCVPQEYAPKESGFFSGIWHGMIIVCSLIGKLFGADVGIYAQHNSGTFYWLGFIIGVVGFNGGGGFAARRRR